MACAEAATPIYEFSQDVHSVESKFCYDLMKYVLDTYKLTEIFYEVFTYDQICNEKDLYEDKETKKNRNRAKRANNKAFCTHIGDAVLAISHVYRYSYKQRFDVLFPLMGCGVYSLKHCMFNYVEELFMNKNSKIAMINAFLVMCSLLVELIVYMAFRGKFYTAYFVWGFFEEIYVACFKREFEECGGWMLLRQVARPWWKSFERAKKNMELNKPEFIYYAQDLNPEIKIKELVMHPFYEDEGDSSDYKYESPKVRKEKVNTIALGINGCYYFCRQKPKFDDNLMVQNDEFSKKVLKNLAILKANNLAVRQVLADDKGTSAPDLEPFASELAASNWATSNIQPTGAAARTVPVPELILHTPVYTVPEGYVPRHLLTSGYRRSIEGTFAGDAVAETIKALTLKFEDFKKDSKK